MARSVTDGSHLAPDRESEQSSPARDAASQHALSLRLLGPDAYHLELLAMHEDFRRLWAAHPWKE